MAGEEEEIEIGKKVAAELEASGLGARAISLIGKVPKFVFWRVPKYVLWDFKFLGAPVVLIVPLFLAGYMGKLRLQGPFERMHDVKRSDYIKNGDGLADADNRSFWDTVHFFLDHKMDALKYTFSGPPKDSNTSPALETINQGNSQPVTEQQRGRNQTKPGTFADAMDGETQKYLDKPLLTPEEQHALVGQVGTDLLTNVPHIVKDPKDKLPPQQIFSSSTPPDAIRLGTSVTADRPVLFTPLMGSVESYLSGAQNESLMKRLNDITGQTLKPGTEILPVLDLYNHIVRPARDAVLVSVGGQVGIMRASDFNSLHASLETPTQPFMPVDNPVLVENKLPELPPATNFAPPRSSMRVKTASVVSPPANSNITAAGVSGSFNYHSALRLAGGVLALTLMKPRVASAAQSIAGGGVKAVASGAASGFMREGVGAAFGSALIKNVGFQILFAAGAGAVELGTQLYGGATVDVAFKQAAKAACQTMDIGKAAIAFYHGDIRQGVISSSRFMGSMIGASLGTFLGIETGPGALVVGAAGYAGGQYAGGKFGEWIADHTGLKSGRPATPKAKSPVLQIA